MKKPQRYSAIFWLSLSALLLAAIGTFFYLKSKPQADKTSSTKPALTVSTAALEQKLLLQQLSANGAVWPWQEAVIGSEAGGLRLTEVRVNVGDQVRKGQILATFAVQSVQAEVAQAQASLAEAQANALDAAGNAEKARSLQRSGALSEQQINQFQTLEKTASARLLSARAMLDVQQVKLKQTQLLAPDDGVISARNATLGAVVGAGSELFRMIRGGRLEWRAEVTSSELSRLKTGMTVNLLPANGVPVKGKLRMIAPTVDPQTRLALVYVDLPLQAGAPNAPAALRAGMFASGEFEIGSRMGITANQQSVLVRDGFSYVFVLSPTGHARQLKVQTGRRFGERIEIREGLTPDAVLVTSGAGFLNDGDLVRVVNPPTPASLTTATPVNPAQAKPQP
jgi:RND family efflux transporter MFP subunit